MHLRRWHPKWSLTNP